jgi:hypothetical protein
VSEARRDTRGLRATPWPVRAAKQARQATPVNKARLGRLVDPVLWFVVAPVCKALRARPARRAQLAIGVLEVIAQLVMPAQLVLEVPPAPRAQPAQLAFVARH